MPKLQSSLIVTRLLQGKPLTDPTLEPGTEYEIVGDLSSPASDPNAQMVEIEVKSVRYAASKRALENATAHSGLQF
jgi:hypothetical protein